VVIATGSVPFKPALPGADQPNVVEVRDVLEGKVEVGNNVVILAYEDHNHALSTADYLAERGKKVEILVGTLYAGAQMDLLTLSASYASVLSKGVVLTPLIEATEIRGNTVIACNVISNIERRIEGVDTVVMSTLGRADNALYKSLKGKVKELHAAGHCMAPRMLADSVLDGAVLARHI
jgi:pyruvate/2-oxoglutarate dehydrogenase complex dihydrolipoamide dehydrogenase (E3) component